MCRIVPVTYVQHETYTTSAQAILPPSVQMTEVQNSTEDRSTGRQAGRQFVNSSTCNKVSLSNHAVIKGRPMSLRKGSLAGSVVSLS